MGRSYASWSCVRISLMCTMTRVIEHRAVALRDRVEPLRELRGLLAEPAVDRREVEVALRDDRVAGRPRRRAVQVAGAVLAGVDSAGCCPPVLEAHLRADVRRDAPVLELGARVVEHVGDHARHVALNGHDDEIDHDVRVIVVLVRGRLPCCRSR